MLKRYRMDTDLVIHFFDHLVTDRARDYTVCWLNDLENLNSTFPSLNIKISKTLKYNNSIVSIFQFIKKFFQ